MGNKMQRRGQMGFETTPGTAVTPTIQLPGKLKITDARTRERRTEERNGRTSDASQVNDFAYESKWTYEEEATFESLQYFLTIGIDGGVTPSTLAGTPNAYRWSFTPGLGSFTAVKSATLVDGDESGAMRAAGCYATKIELVGSDKKPWMLKAEGFGRRHTTGTLAALTPPTTELLKSLLTRWTVDADYATMTGSATAVDNQYFSFTLAIETGIIPSFSQSGSLDMSDIGREAIKATLEFGTKWNASAIAERSAFNNRDFRFIGIRTNGSTISGSNNRAVGFQGAFIYDEFDPMDTDQDGYNVSKGKLTTTDTGSFLFAISVTNTIASL